MTKVFISAGHGGQDPGASGNDLIEKDVNLVVALACYNQLKTYGIETAISRTQDENDPVAQEVAKCNRYQPELAVSIHCNAGGGDGVELWHSIRKDAGAAAAAAIEKELVALGQNSRGLKTKKSSNGRQDYYGFIRATCCPALIVECAFLDNENDVQILNTVAKQQTFGQAIARGIAQHFGVKPKPETKPLYRVQVGAFALRDNAEEMLRQLKDKGFDGFIV